MLFVVLCGVIAAGAFYVRGHGPALAGLKQEAALHVSSLLPESMQNAKKEAPAKKLAANTPDSVKPIHFDFYDELPKAQVDLPQELVDDEEESASAPQVSEAVIKKSVAVPPINKHEDEVVQELASDLSSMKSAETETSSPYILQLSVFHSLDAAKRYRAALTSAGLKVDLVKLRIGKQVVFRLQQGPYHNMDQLQLAKKRLTERGIACDIRKLPPYTT